MTSKINITEFESLVKNFFDDYAKFYEDRNCIFKFKDALRKGKDIIENRKQF